MWKNIIYRINFGRTLCCFQFIFFFFSKENIDQLPGLGSKTPRTKKASYTGVHEAGQVGRKARWEVRTKGKRSKIQKKGLKVQVTPCNGSQHLPNSLNSCRSWCYDVTSGSVETDGGTEASKHIGRGGTDSAWEGRGSQQQGYRERKLPGNFQKSLGKASSHPRQGNWRLKMIYSDLSGVGRPQMTSV